MCKRIKNEVMCSAYNLKCRIYCQDTESFMIEVDDLPRLEIEHEKIYGRKLYFVVIWIKFHPDFKPIKSKDGPDVLEPSKTLSPTCKARLLPKDEEVPISYA